MCCSVSVLYVCPFKQHMLLVYVDYLRLVAVTIRVLCRRLMLSHRIAGYRKILLRHSSTTPMPDQDHGRQHLYQHILTACSVFVHFVYLFRANTRSRPWKPTPVSAHPDCVAPQSVSQRVCGFSSMGILLSRGELPQHTGDSPGKVRPEGSWFARC